MDSIKKEYSRSYYLANKDAILDRSRKWAEQNRDRKREINRAYEARNKEKAKERLQSGSPTLLTNSAGEMRQGSDTKTRNNNNPINMSIIIPSSVDEKNVRVPMLFPLKADADKVVDANGRAVLSIDTSIEPSEAIKFAKLFATAPELFELLGEAYAFLGIVAKNSGTNHGDEGEDKDSCILCQIEAVLDKVK